MRRHAITGSPWTGGREELFRRESPISSVGAIRAPTLLLSNTQDARVAVTQSFRLFRALRDLGVETQFVAYPIPGHFPRDPVRSRDVYRRWVEWIARHFDAPSAATGSR
jgi:dipeptidyl aminopeptidase/acylaminoacyl peptidase